MEAAPPEDAVRERLGPDADDLVQAAFREPGRERFRALGEGVEERGGKHVPGHPADGIQMNVHPRILLRFRPADGTGGVLARWVQSGSRLRLSVLNSWSLSTNFHTSVEDDRPDRRLRFAFWIAVGSCSRQRP